MPDMLTSICTKWPRGVCVGAVPSSWQQPGSFPALEILSVVLCPLGGTVPASWGGEDTLPGLVELRLEHTEVSGTLPPEWGRPTSFTQLNQLRVEECNITGGFHLMSGQHGFSR